MAPNGNQFDIGGQGNLDAARVGFHAAFFSVLEAMGPDPTEELYTEVPSDTSAEEWEWLQDIPGFEEWAGDRKMGEIDAVKMLVRNRDWASGFRIHQNNFKDDKLGLFSVAVAQLAMKARRHRSDLCIKNLLNGFDGNLYPTTGNGLAYDSAFFFSTLHAQGANKHTAALSASGLEAAEQLFSAMTTVDGADPLDVSGTTLIVGPALEWTAKKLLTQEMVPAAGGNTSENNIHRNQYKLIVSKRIKGAQANWWFLADLSQPVKPFLFQNREPISTSAILGGQGTQNDSAPRFKRGEYWFGAEARYNVANFAFQTVVGSKGA